MQGREITIRFNGRPLQAREGQTVAAALHAAGVRTLSRSEKFHRPRGVLCMAGWCGNCLVRVDGIPSVRACTEPVREGMEVETQGGWPSTAHDLLSFIDTVGFLFPAGFVYHYLTRPRWLFKPWARLLRRLAASARPPDPSRVPPARPPLSMEVDLAVVGGGPAGMAAALEASRFGLKTVLVDSEPQLGGALRLMTAPLAEGPYAGRPGREVAGEMARQVESADGVILLRRAVAFGYYGNGLLGVMEPDRYVRLTARQVVVATGAYEQPPFFEDNDRPGVMLSTAAARLWHLYGVAPGRRAVVEARSPAGLRLALDLLQGGVEVPALLWRGPNSPEELAQLGNRGVDVLTGFAVRSALGKNGVRGAVLGPLEGPGRARALACDAIICEGEWRPASELAFHALYHGFVVLEAPSRGLYLSRRPEDLGVADGVYLVGSAGGPVEAHRAIVEGRVAGLSAALALGAAGEDARQERDALARSLT